MPAPSKNPAITSHFAFAACREGSESALKAEVAMRHGPSLRPAYMRPQLITWKSPREFTDGFSLNSIYARVAGLSLGTFPDVPALAEYAAQNLKGLAVHLHVFPRSTPEDGVLEEVWQRMDEKHAALTSALQTAGLTLHSSAPQINDAVLDVIVMEEDGPLLLGLHRHHLHSHASPGGLPRLQMPATAPSRTWLKMEQSLIWMGWGARDALKGKTVLELGSAPGGASLSLLQHGARVIGVDTGVMDPAVLNFQGTGRFTQLPMSASDLENAPLPASINLLVADMNIAPPHTLNIVERLQQRLHAPALLLTLKINNKAMERRMDQFIETVRRFAPGPIRATQLAANRAEICVAAGKL